MTLRKAWYVKPGNFKNLKLVDEEITLPAEDEVQIEIKSIGLNFADVFCVLGLYDAAPKTSFVPGLEYAGIISSVGKNITNFKAGDHVMGVSRFGAYCNRLNTHKNYVVPLPKDWSFEEGSSFLVQVLTAYYGLIELGNLKEGQTVLIHSAAGGVGLWANRICKHFKCFTIGTIGSKSKLDVLKSEAYDQSIVRNTKTFKNQLTSALAGRNLNLIMDSIGGSILKDGYAILGPMGRVIVFGSAHYGERSDRPNYLKLIWKFINRPKIDPQTMTLENKSVMAFNLIYLFENSQIMHEIIKNLSTMELGKPIIGHRYTFENLPDALREFQGGKTKGKLVVAV